MKVQWKQSANHKVDASVAFEVVEAIRAKNNGSATAELVVNVAKAKRNPLHDEFEWDDSVAGHQHRLTQARGLLRNFVVVRDDITTDRPQRVYQVVREAEQKKPGRIRHVYKSTEDIMHDEDLRAELLHRALRELISFRDRYRDLQELAIVIRTIDETLATVEVA